MKTRRTASHFSASQPNRFIWAVRSVAGSQPTLPLWPGLAQDDLPTAASDVTGAGNEEKQIALSNNYII